jgi:c-di-GMP-binding flagellar brake protein YcgR
MSEHDPDLPPDRPPSRAPEEIWRVLEVLRRQRVMVTAGLRGDTLKFQSQLRLLDREGRRMLVERSADPEVNGALLARGRCAFHAEIAAWHVEFVAGGAREAAEQGVPVLEFDFPDVLVRVQRRAHRRALAPERPGLECLADAEGITPFAATIVDAGADGLGFLIYDPTITLEPGTRLRGCRITRPGGVVLSLDLEIRYTQPIVLADGRRARRAGCRIASPSSTLAEFVRTYFGANSAR